MRIPRGKSRKEGSPFQGIATILVLIATRLNTAVEKKVAPFRALPHINIKLNDLNFSR